MAMREYTVRGEKVQVGTAAVVVHVERKLAPKGGPRVLSVDCAKTAHGLEFAAVWTVTAWGNVQRIRRDRVNGDLYDALIVEARELAAEAERLDAKAEGAAIAQDAREILGLDNPPKASSLRSFEAPKPADTDDREPCPHCSGIGSFRSDTGRYACWKCNGSGKAPGMVGALAIGDIFPY